MCGIAVVIGGPGVGLVKTMAESIKHRGYSIEYFSDGDFHVGFVHLPIQELENPKGSYSTDKYVVWLNGYISNYRELADKYSIELSSKSDTEFLAHYFTVYGFKDISELNGFFSILVWDLVKKRHLVFTDRYGIKQLYQARAYNVTYICSEVKGIPTAHKDFILFGLDEEAVSDWHYSLGVMTYDTIHQGICRIPSIKMILDHNPFEGNYDDALEGLSLLWAQSVRRNKIEGLKTGVMLSGGVDSGMIAQDFQPDYSFSMDYHQPELSEIDGIKQNSTGIHHTMICSQALANQYAPIARKYLDDLKAGSCYTNFALTDLASKFCRVLYSGAGGDELFKGYTHRYNKPVNEVIKRSKGHNRYFPHVTHQQYDFLYLRGILTVEDRVSGAYAMETRYPFLDNDLVNFALSLPAEWLENKKILKEMSGLPDSIVNGKKRGWSNPYFTNRQWTEYMMEDKI